MHFVKQPQKEKIMKTASLFVAVIFTCLLLNGNVLASEYGHAEKNHGSELYGKIESRPANGLEGTWIISGRHVNVNENTRISEKHGRAANGQYVEVKGRWIGDTFSAFSIKVEEYDDYESGEAHAKFYGTVDEMPQRGFVGIWQINGRELHVTEHTRIHEKYGMASIGSYVEVEGNFTGESFTVYKIEVKDGRRHGSSEFNNR